MTTLNPPTTRPKSWEIVLLVHYTEHGDYLCETGFVDSSGDWCWHNPMHNTDELEVHGWLELPLIPERP